VIKRLLLFTALVLMAPIFGASAQTRLPGGCGLNGGGCVSGAIGFPSVSMTGALTGVSHAAGSAFCPASGSCALPLPAAVFSNGTGRLTGFRIRTNNTATGLTIRAYISSALPSATPADAVAYSPTWADRAGYLGWIDCTTETVFTDSAELDCSFTESPNSGPMDFVGDGKDNVYVVLTLSSGAAAYTPANSQQWLIQASGSQN
jgi:hypothetical protein